jgi:hypothetical protein
MDVLIVGPARSGSTLLANLLTTPPRRAVLVEPGITRSGMGDFVRKEVARLGMDIDSATWYHEETHQARFARLLQPWLATLERWGVKEVNPGGVSELVAMCPPKHVLLSVRDIGACAASMKEKESLQGPIYGDALAPKSDDWMRQRLLDGAAMALGMLNSPPPGATVTVARYEDFVDSQAHRADVAQRLGWPMDGDPRGSLESIGRGFEIERHGGAVGRSSVDRRRQPADPIIARFAETVVSAAADYQRAFGYDR